MSDILSFRSRVSSATAANRHTPPIYNNKRIYIRWNSTKSEVFSRLTFSSAVSPPIGGLRERAQSEEERGCRSHGGVFGDCPHLSTANITSHWRSSVLEITTVFGNDNPSTPSQSVLCTSTLTFSSTFASPDPRKLSLSNTRLVASSTDRNAVG